MREASREGVAFLAGLAAALVRHGEFGGAPSVRAKALGRLYKDVARQLRVQPEVVLALKHGEGGAGLVLHFDGIPLGTAFGLTEALRKRDVLVLALRRGLTEEDFAAAVDLLAAKPTEDASSKDGVVLADAMSARASRGVLVIVGRDAGDDPAVTWETRVAQGRFVREVRLAVREGRWSPPWDKLRDEMLAEALQPLGTAPEMVRQFLLAAAEAPPLPEGDVDTARVPLLNIIVPGIAPTVLLAVCRSLLGSGSVARGGATWKALVVAGRRVLGFEATAERDRVLRRLCAVGALPLEALPPDVQEWVHAERWVDQLITDRDSAPPNSPNEPGVLRKSVRHALGSRRYLLARLAADRLRRSFPDETAPIFDPETFEPVVADFPDDDERRQQLLDVMTDAGDEAFDALTTLAARGTGRVSDDAGRALGRLGAPGIAAALRELHKGVESEGGAAALLLCVEPAAEPGMTPMLLMYAKHPGPKVRCAALSLLVAANPATAEEPVGKAGHDHAPSVRARAFLLCAIAKVAREKLVPLALDMVASNASKADVEVMKAAIEVAGAVASEGGDKAPKAEDALCVLLTPVGWFGRMTGRDRIPVDVLFAAAGALARLTTPKAEKTLAALERDGDPEVARICREGRIASRARRSSQPVQSTPGLR